MGCGRVGWEGWRRESGDVGRIRVEEDIGQDINRRWARWSETAIESGI